VCAKGDEKGILSFIFKFITNHVFDRKNFLHYPKNQLSRLLIVVLGILIPVAMSVEEGKMKMHAWLQALYSHDVVCDWTKLSAMPMVEKKETEG